MKKIFSLLATLLLSAALAFSQSSGSAVQNSGVGYATYTAPELLVGTQPNIGNPAGSYLIAGAGSVGNSTYNATAIYNSTIGTATVSGYSSDLANGFAVGIPGQVSLSATSKTDSSDWAFAYGHDPSTNTDVTVFGGAGLDFYTGVAQGNAPYFPLTYTPYNGSAVVSDGNAVVTYKGGSSSAPDCYTFSTSNSTASGSGTVTGNSNLFAYTIPNLANVAGGTMNVTGNAFVLGSQPGTSSLSLSGGMDVESGVSNGSSYGLTNSVGGGSVNLTGGNGNLLSGSLTSTGYDSSLLKPLPGGGTLVITSATQTITSGH
jgi:hypothetical protein